MTKLRIQYMYVDDTGYITTLTSENQQYSELNTQYRFGMFTTYLQIYVGIVNAHVRWCVNYDT